MGSSGDSSLPDKVKLLGRIQGKVERERKKIPRRMMADKSKEVNIKEIKIPQS